MDSTATQGAGRRERKKLATKQALALTAMQLAVQRGLENVRVEDITDAVNVSRRTFTNYFSCKEEAIAYAERSGIAYRVEEPKRVETKILSYSDNFAPNRAVPWSH